MILRQTSIVAQGNHMALNIELNIQGERQDLEPQHRLRYLQLEKLRFEGVPWILETIHSLKNLNSLSARIVQL